MDVAIIDWKSCEELSHKTDWEEEDEHALIYSFYYYDKIKEMYIHMLIIINS